MKKTIVAVIGFALLGGSLSGCVYRGHGYIRPYHHCGWRRCY